MRHAQTIFNDGTFLGQGRDPGILKKEIPVIQDKNIKAIYSSPAKRCIETVNRIIPQVNFKEDNRLQEINYGSAEGMTFQILEKKHPEIINEWLKGEDPNFPNGGENISSVLLRLNSFLFELLKNIDGTTVVMTHNVVLRCLIGQAHNIPRQKWHLLSIPHAEPFGIQSHIE